MYCDKCKKYTKFTILLKKNDNLKLTEAYYCLDCLNEIKHKKEQPPQK